MAACLFAAIALTLPPRIAGAQPTSKDRFFAEKRLREARWLVAQRRFDEACPKLEESQKLWPRSSTLLEVASCHEHQGKTATAFSELHRVETEGDATQRQTARRRLAALEPKLARITVELAPGTDAAGIAVTVDDAAVASDAIGKPTPVDPGEHVVAARATDRTPWSQEVSVAEREQKTIVVPALEPVASTTQSPPTQPPVPKVPVAPRPPEEKPAETGPFGIYLRSGAAIYTSPARTAGGIGGGIGLRYALGRWFLVQSDLDYLFGLGNAFEVRVGFGAQRPGVYSPAATLMAVGIFGDQLSFFTDAHPSPVKAPVVAGGLSLAPLRFRGAGTQVSLLDVELEAGSDLPGLGWCLGLTAVEVGTSF